MPKTQKIVVKNLRSSYPHLFSPDQMSGKYTCSFIIDKNDPQIAEIKKVVAAVKADAQANNPGKTIDTSKLFRDGDAERPEDEAFAGKYFFTAKTSVASIRNNVYKRLPGGGVTVVTDESEFYGGCNCMASLVVAWYEFQGKVGVHFLLNGVCAEEGGEAFGSNRCTAEDFGGGMDGNDAEDLF